MCPVAVIFAPFVLRVLGVPLNAFALLDPAPVLTLLLPPTAGLPPVPFAPLVLDGLAVSLNAFRLLAPPALALFGFAKTPFPAPLLLSMMLVPALFLPPGVLPPIALLPPAALSP